jgi:hypothetical protein
MRLGTLKAAVAAVIGSQRVPHLSITDQMFTVVSDAENKKRVGKLDDDSIMYCDVHIVDANVALSKTYYKEKFSQKEDEQVAPTCYSDDGLVPSPQSQEKQCDTCSGCQWNVWGSAITEMGNKGKACRDSWKIALIVPSFSNETLFQFRVPPASLKNWNAYVASFSEFIVDGREGNVGDVVTRIWFEKQGVVNFSPISAATPKQAALAKKVQDEGLALNLIGLSGAAGPALPSPEKAKQLAGPKKEQRASAANILAKASKQAEEVVEEEESELYEVAEEEGTTSEADAKALALMAEVQQEEDEEAALIRAQQEQLAAMRAKKQAAAASAQQQAMVAKTGVVPKSSVGQPKVVMKGAMPLKANISGQAKAPLTKAPLTKAPVAGAPKGAMPLAGGMRTKMSVKPDVEEAEVIEDKPMLPSKQMAKSEVSGIPNTNLPSELQNLLAGIMGS